ncbi:DnaJ like protein subfamily C member 28 [Habropoda laboriosa]|uniref:DnaJ like protein subfamily C member 28 n=1 Tax=Habropoda laboriosa TaxID=597456 RepID=A0A0L7QPJ8_9HYME|nr:PREDICTED: dnaJ homolog subfamily C member 28 [Habropoda laboriosa]KOC60560.1 DnaJ like protein subfamily C member 28 [Habropoda laboriosa]
MLKFNQYNRKPFGYVPCVPYLNLIKRFQHRNNMKKWYQTLEVPEDCEDETLRLAFVYQAKRFHPDSGTSEANAIKFSEIETAYRQIRKARMEEKENSTNLPQVEEFDIKHTAPQHRHYLMYNVGIGTPSKRQKLYTMERAQKAVDNVMEHQLKKLQAEERNTLIGMDKQRAKDIKTRFGMDRLVEDLIQEAMNKGEFKDLPGMGKPLKENTNTRNPYVDFVTYKMNEILIENGFTPEWIQLSKEIREEIQDLRKQLINARNNVGPLPLNYSDESTWNNIVENFNSTTKQINSKIDKYNLLVPILQKQMLHIKLQDLANEVLSMPPKETSKKYNSKKKTSDFINEQDSLFGIITSIFNKKVS